MASSWTAGRFELTSASRSGRTRPPLVCTWEDPRMLVMVSEEIAAATEETDVAAAEGEVAVVITEETIAEVHHLGTMTIVLHCATMKIVDLQDIMKTATPLPLIDMLIGTAHHLHGVMTTMVRHLQGTMRIATAAAAAAEEEAGTTRKDLTIGDLVRTVMVVVVGLTDTTAVETRTEMIGMAVQVTALVDLVLQAPTTGIPGHGGITEAAAGVMSGRQDQLCLQDRHYLQDTERGAVEKAFPS